MPGPPPTPTVILKARGSKRAKARKREPSPPAGAPHCPPHLSKAAKNCWHRMIELLLPMKLVSKIDGDQLALYCTAYARWLDAEAQLARDGVIVKSPNGYPIQHPALGVAHAAMKQMSGYLSKFGMNPADRTRLRAEPVTTDSNKSRFFPDASPAPALRLAR